MSRNTKSWARLRAILSRVTVATIATTGTAAASSTNTDEISAALRWASVDRDRGEPNLSLRSWPELGNQTAQVYREAVALPARGD